MKNKLIASKLVILSLFIMGMSGCIIFNEWDKNGNKSQDFNDKGLPIAIYTDEPEDYKPNDDILFSTANSKRLLGSMHEFALDKITFSVPEDWMEIRGDFYWSPSYGVTLHVYTFREGTTLAEAYVEYKSFESQIKDIKSAEAGFYENFPLDENVIFGLFGGIEKETGNDWIGCNFIFQIDSFTYLFMWDTIDSINPQIEEEILSAWEVIDSIKPGGK